MKYRQCGLTPNLDIEIRDRFTSLYIKDIKVDDEGHAGLLVSNVLSNVFARNIYVK
jgi:hypothetical protein